MVSTGSLRNFLFIGQRLDENYVLLISQELYFKSWGIGHSPQWKPISFGISRSDLKAIVMI